jgi:hypothetical protein
MISPILERRLTGITHSGLLNRSEVKELQDLSLTLREFEDLPTGWQTRILQIEEEYGCTPDLWGGDTTDP